MDACEGEGDEDKGAGGREEEPRGGSEFWFPECSYLSSSFVYVRQ